MRGIIMLAKSLGVAKIDYKKIIASSWLLLNCIMGAMLIYRNTSISTPLIDFTYQLENSYRIIAGQVPYRDFILVLTPVIYYLDAFFLLLFKESNIGQIILTICLHVVTIVLSNKMLIRLTNNLKFTALCTSLIALSGAVNYPFVQYNDLCFFFMLISIYYLSKTYDSYTITNAFIAGVLAALPFYAKQSFGLFFVIAIYIYIFGFCVKRKNIINFIVTGLGSVSTVVIFLLYLALYRIPVSVFLYQTFIFPGNAKDPIRTIIALTKAAFDYKCLITVIIVFLLLYIYENSRLSICKKNILTICLTSTTYLIIVKGNSDCYNVKIVFCYVMYYSFCFILFKNLFVRIDKRFSIETFTIISFFVFLLGLFTNRSDLPMCFFCIAVALIYKWNASDNYIHLVTVLLGMLLMWQITQCCNIEYSWVNESGELQIEEDFNSKFYRIGTKGSWLEEMEIVSKYICENCKEAKIVEVPCEDPIYWATDSEPQLDFFQLYPETCPYDENSIASIIAENDIDIIIVKRKCQFEHYMITEDEIGGFEQQAYEQGYRCVNQIGCYDILVKE